ncbi:Acyl-CoA dehydrogenase [Reichenbachiella faecimaris]|uniref:Acyl-CoA dehydrogenase n=1 Tax=Reichenbachiella faecimaris TaxID=692418 RepID=A0A1W2G5Y4_REIFA|nr:acyl-CoA dehydrogenase family protein [Reichenbachiella faecimaris]SMD31944.1 Acyl-CoA dehydrogenase [Reichenbachiella faecimaris]
MIDLFATTKVQELIPKYVTFIEEEVIPIELQLLDVSDINAHEQQLMKLREKAKIAGLWAPHLSQSHGGLGLNLVEFAQVSEVMGMTPFGHYAFNCQAPDIGNMELLEGYASNDIKSAFLAPLQEGKIRSCFSMTEPEHAGSNPKYLSTTAVKHGDYYVINGHKWFTSSADGAAFAIVMAVTNPEAESPYQRASMIVVPTTTDGFELVRNIPIMGEAGARYVSHAEVRYNNCKVPASHLIHEEGQGFMLAQQRLGPGRIHHCMRWIGICERALDLMCKRATKRKISSKEVLGDKQTIQNWIAESRTEIDAARLLVLHAAHKIEIHGSKAAKQEISSIKYYVAHVLQQVLDRAIQVHGAMGITDDLILSWWYRHERGARIYDGPDEVHKSVIARSVLKDYQTKEQ